MIQKPLIMGIVNVTPDSFSDGGKFYDPAVAIEHGIRLLGEGANILDVGGESTRPNAKAVSVDEEIARVIPVIDGLVKRGAVVSVDTRNAMTMRAAVEAGATIINDVMALQGDGSLAVAAQLNAQVCLMHMQGEPQTMQNDPQYANVVDDVYAFLRDRIDACINAGIKRENIIIDVGIGFGKTAAHNIELIKNLDRFNTLNVRQLLGVSRKRFVEAIAGPAPANHRLGGSLAVALHGADKGVDILRVHDVHETKQALALWRALKE